MTISKVEYLLFEVDVLIYEVAELWESREELQADLLEVE